MADDFDALVEKYHLLVISLVRRYYGGRFQEQADDLSQEVWTKLWESFKKNESNIVNFKSYLYRTVQTTLWDAARSLDKDGQLSPIEELGEPGIEANEDRVHDQIRVAEMLERLKPEEARIMKAYLKGFNTGEIASLMGCGEGRVRNLLTRIKKKMAGFGGSDAHQFRDV